MKTGEKIKCSMVEGDIDLLSLKVCHLFIKTRAKSNGRSPKKRSHISIPTKTAVITDTKRV